MKTDHERLAVQDGATARRLKAMVAWGGMAAVGATRARRQQQGRLRVLMYHGVVPRVGGPAAFGNLFLGAEAFERQMRYLQRSCRPVSLEEVLTALEQRRPFPEGAVLVTFDDGYANVLTTALPILRAHGIPAVAFVSAGLVGQGSGQWFDVLRVLVARCARERAVVELGDGCRLDGERIQDPERAFLGWCASIERLPALQADRVMERLVALGREERLPASYPEFALAGWEAWRRACADGLLDVASHGMQHSDLTSLPPEACVHALAESKQLVERELSRPCRVVAYPYGRWNAAVAEAARAAGYRCAMTAADGVNDAQADPFALRRTMIGDKGNFMLFRARTSGVWERLRSVR